MIKIKRIDEFTSKRINEMAVKPSVFSQYDEVDTFDSNYFKVMKNGLYNLIDRNGKPISGQWFEDITQNNDGTFSVTVKNDVEKSSSVGTYSNTRELEKSIEIDNDLKDTVGIPAGIVFTDIIPVKPYTIKSIETKKSVNIIARVRYDGVEVLLGNDGKLYTSDGHEYSVSKNTASQDLIKKYNLVYNEETGLYDCDGDIRILPDLVSSDGKLIIKFGVVKGDFDCDNNKLTTLEGAPQEVGGGFSCYNNKLTSLEGAPKEVGGYFDCDNNKLTTLEGAPQEVGEDFSCGGNKLTSLEGAPKEVGGYFDCSNNPNLVLPKVKPSWIKGKIIS